MKKTKSLIISFIVIFAAALGMTYFQTDDTATNHSQLTENMSIYENQEHIRVSYIDVGQGDCILITAENNFNILIDGGEKENAGKLKNYMSSRNIKKIDALVATHPHSDHIGSLEEIVRGFEIGKIYMPKVMHTSKTYKNLLTAIKEKGLKVTTAKAGVSIETGGKLKAEFLSPANSYDELNNSSAVLRIEYGDKSFLFMGDAEIQAEYDLLKSGANLKADVLKTGHHGSSTSTSNPFLKEVSPEYAIIMCGKNNEYNHPHTEILEKLTKSGVKILRTDKLGTIEIYTDGIGLDVIHK